MPIVDISGFGNDEVEKMKNIRLAIKIAFARIWSFNDLDLDQTSVNFAVDPSVESSLEVHTMARIYTKQFIKMTDSERDEVCSLVCGLLERFGEHKFNEAFSPGYTSMQGRPNPAYKAR